MRTLLDPFEVNPQLALVGSSSGSVDIEVSWDDEPSHGATRFPCTQGVTAEAWSRARGWSADD